MTAVVLHRVGVSDGKGDYIPEIDNCPPFSFFSRQGKGDDAYRVVPLRRLDGFKPESPYFTPTDG